MRNSRMFRCFVSITLAILFFTRLHAQKSALDSLTRKIHDESLIDTTKVLVLLGIADQLISPEGQTLPIEHNFDSAIVVLNQALLLSKETDFDKGIGWSYQYLGRVFSYKRLRNQALDYFLKGLQLVEKSGNKLMIASCHNDIGNIYLDLQREMDSDQMAQLALSHYGQCLKSALEFNSSDAQTILAVTTANMGEVFLARKNYDSAIYYYQRSIELAKNTEEADKIKVWRWIDLIKVYKEQGDLFQALQLGRRALGVASKEKAPTRNFLGDIYSTLAYLQLELNDYDSAYYFITKTIALSREDINPANDPRGFLTYYYFKKGDFNKAILNAQQIIDSAKSRTLVPPETYKIISDSYAELGNDAKALEYYRIFTALTDSLYKENTAAKLLGQQADYAFAKQTNAIDLLEKEAEINNLSIAKQKQTEIFFLIVLALGLLIIVVLVYLYRLSMKAKKKQENFFKEIEILKSRFFANISHEFRTPLTLILGPLEKRLAYASDFADKKELSIMHRNAVRLLTLVNQLLDLSRLEAGTLKLQGNIQSLNEAILSIGSQFSSMADSKGITFRVLADKPVRLFFDSDKLEKIITNLLSNAFKFTPTGGFITVTLNQHESTEIFKNGYAEITVSDSGSGIEAEHLEKIFDRFYQVDASSTRTYEGSGIGLALVKELVDLHQGYISATSTPGSGSSFTIQLPLGMAHVTASDMGDTEARINTTVLSNGFIAGIEHEKERGEHARPKVLIVEDNADLRFYLHKNLNEFYEIHEGVDGEQGLTVAKDIIPDLIISDVMMPKMDGLHLCEKLKHNEKTSHIPVILLTAKADIETKLEGLHTGADDYIAKPFDARELNARIYNLIENRKRMQQRFSSQFSLSASEIQVESTEGRFLKKVKTVIENHIGDFRFSVETLAAEVAMSSPQLYRKLKALTGQTPNELIRNIRLDRAASLLKQHAGNVSEVADRVGFNNMSYFSKCFKEKFNSLPSEFFKATE